MASARTCVVAVFLVVAVVQSSRVRRSDVNGYLFDSGEDASIAGDYVGAGADCDDDSSESIELAYIINKREVPDDQRGRSAQAPAATKNPTLSQPNTRPVL